MLKRFSRCTTLRVAKSPFFHPALLFSFRDALDKKDNKNDKNKQRIDEKQAMRELEEHLPEEFLRTDYSNLLHSLVYLERCVKTSSELRDI